MSALMRPCTLTAVSTLGVAVAVLCAPVAQADNAVTYQVVSDTVSVMNVEYVDATGRKLLKNVALPWRLDVSMAAAAGPTGRGAQVRADWRPAAQPGRWVRVTIHSDGTLLCQSTLDIGNATCYGNTPHIS